MDASFVLFDVKDLTRVQAAFNLLNTLGIWLPIIAIVLLGVGVWAAKGHRRALVGAAVGVAVAMVGLGLALAVFRTIYLDAVPAAGWRTGPVGTWVDANKPLLRTGAVTLAALALVFWGQPTGKVILLLAGLLLVALALIEFLGQPPQPTAAPTTRT